MRRFSHYATDDARCRIFHVTAVPTTVKFLSGHIQAASAAGYEVHVASGPGGAASLKSATPCFTHHQVHITRSRPALGDLSALFRLWRIFRRTRPLIVQGHTPKAALLSMVAARAAHVPVRVYHAHGLPPSTEGVVGALMQWGQRCTVYCSTGVIAVSPSLRNEMLQRRLAKSDQVAVLRQGSVSGVNAETYFSPALVSGQAVLKVRTSLGVGTSPLVGFVGRIVPDKGIADLVHAVRVVRTHLVDAQLLIVGAMDSEHPLDDAVREQIAVTEWIHVVDWQADLRPYYLAMEILVLPSRREGFGMVLLEAAAMGRPVIATRVVGCTDAVEDGETGILVEPASPLALAEAMVALLSDPDLRRRLGEAGRIRAVRDFRSTDIEMDLLDYYRRLTKPANLANRSGGLG